MEAKYLDGDMPKEDPPGYYDGDAKTKMRIVKRQQYLAQSSSEVTSLVLSPGDAYLAVSLAPRLGKGTFGETKAWHVATAKELTMKGFATPSMWSNRGMVFAPPPDDGALLCAYSWTDMESTECQSRLDIFDLTTRRRRSTFNKPTMSGVMAYSPNGAMVAGRKDGDPTKVVMMGAAAWSIKGVIPSHMAQVTHVAFTSDSDGIVTMAKDGWLRLSSAATGKTAGKVRINTRYDPSLLTVAADATSVSTVWGRDVRIWSLETGEVHGYDLDDVRESEGWPICISPDGRLLVCRTESGFDISDISTGGFLAEVRGESSFYTCGSFTSDGCGLFLGKWSGAVDLFNVIT